jgi:hypothetical protein
MGYKRKVSYSHYSHIQSYLIFNRINTSGLSVPRVCFVLVLMFVQQYVVLTIRRCKPHQDTWTLVEICYFQSHLGQIGLKSNSENKDSWTKAFFAKKPQQYNTNTRPVTKYYSINLAYCVNLLGQERDHIPLQKNIRIVRSKSNEVRYLKELLYDVWRRTSLNIIGKQMTCSS